MWKQILFSIICSVTFLSCDNELHMLFPEGPAGMSAYEVWVKEVLAGNIDWPEDRTDVNNFFLYLKGEDGKNGADGQSAYELWLAEVEKGLENPHNPGHEWPKDQTDMNYFWYYLSGADGQNGVTPNIGENGNWWIGGEDTGIPAFRPRARTASRAITDKCPTLQSARTATGILTAKTPAYWHRVRTAITETTASPALTARAHTSFG